MAAFCGCCGAEITDWAEACPVCKTPRHGMIPAGFPRSLAEESCPMCIPEPADSTEPDLLSQDNQKATS